MENKNTVVVEMIDMDRDYTQVIERKYENNNCASSINIVPDGIGIIYCAVKTIEKKEFKFRVLSDDLTFNENFGQITNIQITATCPYRMIIRG